MLIRLLPLFLAMAVAETENWCPRAGQCWQPVRDCAPQGPCDRVCGNPGGDLFVVHHEVEFCHADEVCQKYGGVLANLNNGNFIDASNTAFACSGPASETWVRSFDGDSHRGECLVLSTGNQAGGGAVNVPTSCQKRLYTLCSRKQPKMGPYCPRVRPDSDNCHPKPKPCGCKQNCDCKCIDKPYLFEYSGKELPTFGPEGQFTYLARPDDANDGKLSIEDGSLVINSYPFTQWRANTLSSAKWVAYSTKDFTVPAHGELSFRATARAQLYGQANNPFGGQVLNAQSDIRLGYFAFGLLSFELGTFYTLIVTNTKIYAVAVRTTIVQGVWAGYNYFPLMDIVPNSEHDLAVNIDCSKGFIRFIIDGEEKFRLNTLFNGSKAPDQYCGMDYSGRNQAVCPSTVRLIMGNGDILDSYSPCNIVEPTIDNGKACVFPANETALVKLDPLGLYFNPRFPGPASFVYDVPTAENNLWGQGVISQIRDVKVALCESHEHHGDREGHRQLDGRMFG